MGQENLGAYIGHVIQKVTLASKSGDITAAQAIAFHNRLSTIASKLQVDLLDKASLLEQLSVVENDLKRWEDKRHVERTGQVEARAGRSTSEAG